MAESWVNMAYRSPRNVMLAMFAQKKVLRVVNKVSSHQHQHDTSCQRRDGGKLIARLRMGHEVARQ